MNAFARSLAEQWAEKLATAVEAMSGERPSTVVRESAATVPGALWCRHNLSFATEPRPSGSGPLATARGSENPTEPRPSGPLDRPALWAGAAEESCLDLGASILKAAGVETTEPEDARNTWFELLNQSTAGLAANLGRALSTEVSTEDAGPGETPPAEAPVFEVELQLPDTKRTAWIAFSPALLDAIGNPQPVNAALPAPVVPAAVLAPPAVPKSLDLLLDVELPVSISFGRAQLPLKDVLKLTTGAIVELNRTITEPVELLVNNCVIARGEVVVIEGNYGVRIDEIVSREHRMRSIR